VLAFRLIGNHPLPDGNKRVGNLCAIEFVVRNSGMWTHSAGDPEGDETVAMIEGPAAGSVREDELRGSPNDSGDVCRPRGRGVDDGPDRHPRPRIPNRGHAQMNPPSTLSTTLYALSSRVLAQLQ